MTKPVKKNEFLLPFARLLTREGADVYDGVGFRSSESVGDEEMPALASPVTWDMAAVAAMAEAACPALPADLLAIEENTVPSWLWRHRAAKNANRRVRETDLRDIIDRMVGSAAAKAWKLTLFTGEKHARAFYDETRAALMKRHIAIAPDVVSSLGLAWAYGIDETPIVRKAPKTSPVIALSNDAMDSVIGKSPEKTALWKKLFMTRGRDVTRVSLRLSDITAEWLSPAPSPARAAVDLMAVRHNDGSLNIDALRHHTRLLAILLDLHDRDDVTIGFVNLAPLLLALGLGYDSDAARALAASIAALMTAECYAASAEMAALRGESKIFVANRDGIMRSLRNHRRAIYGDANDYEKLSVSPAALTLKNCPDLALVAEAQRRWDEAIDYSHAFGLRAIGATDLTPSPVLAVLMSSASQGLEPLPRLTSLQQEDDDHYQTILHPAATEALARLDYPRNISAGVAQHIAGLHSLRKAPAISHAALRGRGLSDAVIEKIEAYLPCVDTVRLAVTPWIVGVDFCRTALKIPARTLNAPRFDMLKHLGFSDADIDAANLYCYGHGTARNAKILHLRHRPIFACGIEVSTEARLRMAAAVQGFIGGDTGIAVTLPAAQSVTCGAEAALTAWHAGIKSLTLVFDPALAAKPVKTATTARRIKVMHQPEVKSFKTSSRRSRGGKSAAILTKRSSVRKRLERH